MAADWEAPMAGLTERVNGVERTANDASAKADRIHELKADLRVSQAKFMMLAAFLAALGTAALNYIVEHVK